MTEPAVDAPAVVDAPALVAAVVEVRGAVAEFKEAEVLIGAVAFKKLAPLTATEFFTGPVELRIAADRNDAATGGRSESVGFGGAARQADVASFDAADAAPFDDAELFDAATAV